MSPNGDDLLKRGDIVSGEIRTPFAMRDDSLRLLCLLAREMSNDAVPQTSVGVGSSL
jgi:hypothetical protein